MMSVKSAIMFENIRDRADCIQLSSIMGSSLLSDCEAQHVNISKTVPWWVFPHLRLLETTPRTLSQTWSCLRRRPMADWPPPPAVFPAPASSADQTRIPSRTECWAWTSRSRSAGQWLERGRSTPMQYLTARWVLTGLTLSPHWSSLKVLSRNHALLWYENGKFYLQDTKSSNGTFVNNQRLSKGSEESPAREVCSGDILQFGVDVMENSRKVSPDNPALISTSLCPPDSRWLTAV